MLAVCLKCLPVVVIDPSKLMFLIKKGGKNNRSDMKGTGKNWLKCFHVNEDEIFLVFEYMRSHYCEGDNEVFLNCH